MTDLPVLSSPHQITAVKLARELVPVPEWGVAVWVWELTGEDLDAYRQGMYRTRGSKVTIDLKNNTARMLCFAIRDADGNRIYGDHDAHRLLGLGSAGLERLAKVARRLSRMGDDDDEDLEGNSDAAPSGGSSSISPSLSAVPSESS